LLQGQKKEGKKEEKDQENEVFIIEDGDEGSDLYRNNQGDGESGWD